MTKYGDIAKEDGSNIVIGDAIHLMKDGTYIRLYECSNKEGGFVRGWAVVDGKFVNKRLTHQEFAGSIYTNLKDFPNSPDPRLPYDFDLWHDIKTVDQLIEQRKYCDRGPVSISTLLKQHKDDPAVKEYNRRLRKFKKENR